MSVKYLTLAVEQGDPAAMNDLGDCYEKGIGVEQNISKAIALYLKAMELGEATAKWSLGELFYRGEGLPMDKEEAYRLLKEAADDGCKGAMKFIEENYKDR